MADEFVARRFRIALDMYEFGERMVRSGLRRRHPAATEEQIAASGLGGLALPGKGRDLR